MISTGNTYRRTGIRRLATASTVGVACLALLLGVVGESSASTMTQPGPTGKPVSSQAALSLQFKACKKGGPTKADRQAAAKLSPKMHGPRMDSLDAGQFLCARVIVATVRAKKLPRRAAVIAVTTAITESTLHDYTQSADHDSLGLYQQRPSEGWGTPAQVENPVYATHSFLRVMEEMFPGGTWQHREIGVVCQAVQRSADPGAYQPEVPDARLIVDYLWK